MLVLMWGHTATGQSGGEEKTWEDAAWRQATDAIGNAAAVDPAPRRM